MDDLTPRLTADEISAEAGELLPDKEVFSLLDLFVNVNLALDLAAPVDLAVAANANIAAPIDAAVGANVLSIGSTAQALADQGAAITQHLSGDAIAHAPQQAALDQSAGGTGTGTTDPGTTPTDTGTGSDAGTVTQGNALDGPLLNVNVDVHADANVASPIDGAVAANANAAAPINAAASANVASVDSTSTAIADQQAIINQDLDGVTAQATAAQNAQIQQ
jgi:hypothetical protein